MYRGILDRIVRCYLAFFRPAITSGILTLEQGAADSKYPAQHQPKTKYDRQDNDRYERIIKEIDPDKKVDKCTKQGMQHHTGSSFGHQNEQQFGQAGDQDTH